MKKKFLTILTIFILLLVVGCKKEDSKTLVIELEGNPTTGYEWTMGQSSNVEILDIKSEYVQNETENNEVGVGGKYIFTIKGLKEGSAELTFKYKRLWEDTEFDKTVVYLVTVDEELNVTETHSEME